MSHEVNSLLAIGSAWTNDAELALMQARAAMAYIGSLLGHGFAVAPVCPSIRHNDAEMYPLSSREAAILRLIGSGLSNKNIGRELSIAPETVKSHVKSIFVKLATRTRAEAVSRAVKLGLL